MFASKCELSLSRMIDIVPPSSDKFVLCTNLSHISVVEECEMCAARPLLNACKAEVGFQRERFAGIAYLDGELA